MEPQPGWFTRRLAALLASNALPTLLQRSLHRRLAFDATFAVAYNALRRAERAAGGDVSFTAAQSELIESLVLSSTARTHEDARSRSSVAALATAMAAAAAFALSAGPPALPPVTGALSERGASTEPLGVTVACIDQATRTVTGRATAGARTPAAPLSCTPGALLAFSTTNLGEVGRYVLIVGVGERGELRWYAPFTADGPSVAVPAGTMRAPLPVAADTAQMTREAKTSLHVLFFAEQRSGAEVARALAAASSRGTLLQALDRLPIDADAQARVDVAWAPGGG